MTVLLSQRTVTALQAAEPVTRKPSAADVSAAVQQNQMERARFPKRVRQMCERADARMFSTVRMK